MTPKASLGLRESMHVARPRPTWSAKMPAWSKLPPGTMPLIILAIGFLIGGVAMLIFEPTFSTSGGSNRYGVADQTAVLSGGQTRFFGGFIIALGILTAYLAYAFAKKR